MPTGTTVEQAAKQAGDAKDVAQTHLQHLRTSIEKAEPQFAMALPEHVRPDRFIRAALTALNVVPRLAECEPRSVIAGLMQAAQLGLEVADVRGQCYLIPRRDSRAGVMKATFQLGYRGMIDLAARSGITVTAEEVCEGDALDYTLGSRRHLTHRPTLGPRGKAYAYYAVATFSDHREPEFKIMGRAQIEEHRDRFASTRDGKGTVTGPWVEHFDAMARKTVIRALLNYLPVSVELHEALHADAIEATAVDTRPTSPELPANADGLTGEIDAMTVIDVDDSPTS